MSVLAHRDHTTTFRIDESAIPARTLVGDREVESFLGSVPSLNGAQVERMIGVAILTLGDDELKLAISVAIAELDLRRAERAQIERELTK